MERAEWTFEKAAAGASSEGLEGYTLETASGESLGRVVAVLDHEGARWLAYSTGAPPLPGPMRAVRLETIAEVDHDALVIALRSGRVDPIELQASNAVEGDSADASRVSDVPGGVPAPSQPHHGPRDKARAPLHVALFVGGFALTLAVVAITTATDSAWTLLLLVVPGALMLAGLVLGLLTLRDPYDR